jgi:hypothetical protein
MENAMTDQSEEARKDGEDDRALTVREAIEELQESADGLRDELEELAGQNQPDHAKATAIGFLLIERRVHIFEHVLINLFATGTITEETHGAPTYVEELRTAARDLLRDMKGLNMSQIGPELWDSVTRLADLIDPRKFVEGPKS